MDAQTRRDLLRMLLGYLVVLAIWLFAWLVLGHDFNRAAAWGVVIGFPFVLVLGAVDTRTRQLQRRPGVIAALAVPLFVWLVMLPVVFTTLPAAVGIPLYAIAVLVLMGGVVMAFRDAVRTQ